MGLFDVFKKKEAPAAPDTPASVAAEAAADVLCAPVAGRVIKMADVPDPVFSGEVLGKGCAVWPEEDVVYAPVSGTVTVTMGHAVGIQGNDGVEVLVHVGVDTVNLQGKGFTGYVKQGDAVKAGQPVIKMDRSVIAEAGYADCVVLAVSNTAEFSSVELTAEPEATVAAGAAVLKVSK
ncbi:MAG: PTS glucose transporter subunit IIA [Coriobacteriaceae bacterium]|nr:PTS glucose transporter subunit IIA [Coriobacteriaceae bacterium]